MGFTFKFTNIVIIILIKNKKIIILSPIFSLISKCIYSKNIILIKKNKPLDLLIININIKYFSISKNLEILYSNKYY
jgi:hypothetical protein